jgi:hypothetical protein
VLLTHEFKETRRMPEPCFRKPINIARICNKDEKVTSLVI